MRLAYLHGFASSSASAKGRALRTELRLRGWDLHLPDLNGASLSELRVSRALERLDAELHDGPCRLVGSSLGGYLAALWSSLRPDAVDRLVLLCPGFDLPSRWPSILGEGRFKEWREQGSMQYNDAEGVSSAVPFDFYMDAERHPPFPLPLRCRALVLHGEHDAVVPPASSHKWAAMVSSVSPDAAQVEILPDDHALTASLPRVVEAAADFITFGLGPAFRLMGAWRGGVAPSVELLLAGDIVSRPPPLFRSEVMVCPANERLVGTRLPYFPVGGPCPEPPSDFDRTLGTSMWGGMSAGEGMLYPAAVVDGRVSAEGGAELRHALASLAAELPGGICTPGGAVSTGALGNLGEAALVARVVHTVAPYWGADRWRETLFCAWHASLDHAFSPSRRGGGSAATAVCAPLLGAGARGAPVPAAAEVAADAIANYRGAEGAVVRLVVRDAAVARDVANAFERQGCFLSLLTPQGEYLK